MNQSSLTEIYNRLFISENLKKLRIAHKLSTTDVGKIIGKSRQGYANYENGTREISIKDLVALSGFYNVSIDVIVGNPFTLRNDIALAFRSFETIESELKEVMPFTISTIHDDVICYKKNDLDMLFFWKTSLNQEDHIMLFNYYEKILVSKVFFKDNGDGHFYINDKPKYFNKAHAENIVFKGVLMADLHKYMDIPHFFD
ncbi:MAG: helix-turn-helix transcriptional regulator [Tenericutes bacterium]|nr:helix-turn-helix transcriptional regulator [Mycoplasmatota bacterium]